MRVVIAIDDTNPFHAGFYPSRCYKNWTFPSSLAFDYEQTKASFMFARVLFVWSAVSPVRDPYRETVLSDHPQCGLSEATPGAGEDSQGFAKRHLSPLVDDPSSRGLSLSGVD